MKLIKLTQGKFAQVDDEDFESLNQWKWFAYKGENDNTFYARRKIKINGKEGIMHLHRNIMNTPKNMLTDHIDHNGLNCQRNNMRICTYFENNGNTSSRENSSSKYLGVSFYKKIRRWVARINFNKKNIHLGIFKSETEAALIYNEAAIKYHGEFANLNQI